MTDGGLAWEIGAELVARGLTLSVAESCTGGLLGDRISDVPGSSVYFMGGAITYSYEAKEHVLGVRHDTLISYGAVSEQTAKEMARGARQLFDTDVSLAITGIAGPGGGMPDKPVGLVYIALSSSESEVCRSFVWSGNRRENKAHSAEAALSLLRDFLDASSLPPKS
jgi:nicotinamide-nucleotide amidase